MKKLYNMSDTELTAETIRVREKIEDLHRELATLLARDREIREVMETRIMWFEKKKRRAA